MSNVVGRVPEIAAVEAFLGSEHGVAALAIVGEAGIGKSTLWEEAVRRAAARGGCVLRCRPAESEARLLKRLRASAPYTRTSASRPPSRTVSPARPRRATPPAAGSGLPSNGQPAAQLVVVGATPDFQTVAQVTKEFPKTRFVIGGSVNDPPFHANPNVSAMTFDDREDGYLAGYLAALMTKPRGTVSAVGGPKTPTVERLIAGFKTGAKRAHPSVRVLVGYTDTFVDQSACERLANDQIQSRASVVFDVAGDCGFGALQAAGIRGVWGIGVDDDLSYLGPHILASAVKRGDRAVELAVRLFLSGTLPGGRDVHLGLGSGSIGLVGISGRVPLAARAKLEQVAGALRAHDQAAGR